MSQTHEELISILNRAKYFYLNRISEPRDNSVRIIVDEAADPSSGPATKRTTGGDSENFTSFGAIRPTGKCKRFELLWKWYVAYLVTEEAAGCMGRHEDEISEGGLFSVCQKSHFLDHIARDTGGHSRPVLHFRIICLNHLIDVASYDPPEVRIVGTIAEIENPKLSSLD